MAEPPTSSDPGSEPQEMRAVTLLRLSGLADNVSRTGRLVLPGVTAPLNLVDLKEFELFLPGEKKVIIRDANGTIVSETPFEGRFFSGRIDADTASRATLLIAPTGVYGIARSASAKWSLQPIDNATHDNESILQEVKVTTALPGQPFIHPQAFAPAGNLSLPAGNASVQADPLPPGPGGYGFCSWEFERCSFSGTRHVAFGKDPSYTYQMSVVDGIDCTREAFGGTDPAPGVTKACFIRDPSPQGPSGYTYCAHETERCSFTGTKDLAYGADGQWRWKTGVANGIDCTSAAFGGDPISGTVKACFTKDTAPPPPPDEGPTGFTWCAAENTRCAFTGSKEVAYGANGQFTNKFAANGIDCNNAEFGDPIPGTVKACYTKDITQNPTGPTGFAFCVWENSRCDFSGTRDVAYGANGLFDYRNGISGGINCNNVEFQDPAFGTQKACFTKVIDAGSGGPDGFAYCSNENSDCTGGLRDVAFGTNGKFVYLYSVTGAIPCSWQVFDDPAPTLLKKCYSRPTTLLPCEDVSRSARCILFLKPYADRAYTQYTTHWEERTAIAIADGRDMWRDETRLEIYTYSIESAGRDFAQVEGGCGSYDGVPIGDGGLKAFSEWVRSIAAPVGAEAFTLFEAANNPASGLGVGGCGHKAALRSWGSVWAVDPTTIVVAKDFHRCDIVTPCDSYDPTDTDHLALSLHHELSHNAGEKGHPPDGSACNYNLMAEGPLFACQWLWRTDSTQAAVRGYAYPRVR